MKMLTVIMSVFDGGDGSTSGGKSERSRESGDLLPDDARERCGEGMVACIFANFRMRNELLLKILCVSYRSSRGRRDSTSLIFKVASRALGAVQRRAKSRPPTACDPCLALSRAYLLATWAHLHSPSILVPQCG